MEFRLNIHRGDETLYLGLAKLDRSLSLLDGRREWPILSFDSWCMATGRGIEERKAFARRVFDMLTQDTSYFESE